MATALVGAIPGIAVLLAPAIAGELAARSPQQHPLQKGQQTIHFLLRKVGGIRLRKQGGGIAYPEGRNQWNAHRARTQRRPQRRLPQRTQASMGNQSAEVFLGSGPRLLLRRSVSPEASDRVGAGQAERKRKPDQHVPRFGVSAR